MTDEDRKRLAGYNFLEKDGFYYYRICRKESVNDLYTQEAIDSAIAIAESHRPPMKLGDGSKHDQYNVWTNIKNHLQVMKYKCGVTK